MKSNARYKRLPAGLHGLDPETVSSDQRERLRCAMVELTAERGYHAVRVIDLTRLARVSRPTFYALYADKEECFIEAYDAIAKSMTGTVVEAFMSGEDRAGRIRAAASAFAGIALAEQDAASLMVLGALGAGSEALKRHHRVFTLVEEQLESTRKSGISKGADLTTNMIIGGIREVTAKRLRQGRAEELPDLAEELARWAISYPAKLPAGLALEGCEKAPSGPAESPEQDEAPASGMGRLPSGRHELSRQFVLENQRERIVDAIAELVSKKGYSSLTIPAIAKHANVSHQTFYEIYPSKHEAFLGAQEFGLLQGVQLGEEAYQDNAEDWPYAVAQVIRVALAYFAGEPAQTRLNLVDVLAAGPQALEVREQGLERWARFLDPGQKFGTAPKIAAEAVTGGAWQIIHQYVVRERVEDLEELIPQLIYLVLAPFIGPKDAAKMGRRKPRQTASKPS